MAVCGFLFPFFLSKSPSASQIPTDIADRLVEFEKGRLADREKMEELAQKVSRLEAENRSLRDWSSDRFMSMWESMKGHDVNIMQALQNIHTLQLEDTTRQIRIQETAKSMESMIRIASTSALPTFSTMPSLPRVTPPAMAAPTPNLSTTLPAAEPIVEEAAQPTLEEANAPTDDSEEEGEIPSSKKRGHSVGSEAPNSKRRKQ
jgi:hypothetical protein